MWPHSYHSHHSSRTVIELCIIMWVYVHIVIGVGLFNDTMYYQRPLAVFGCHLNPTVQFEWFVVAEFGVFAWPLLIMLVTAPVVLDSRRWRARRTVPNVLVTATSGTSDVVRFGKPPRAPAMGMQPASRKASHHGYYLLGLVTVSVWVCWAPVTVYYAMQMYVPGYEAPLFEAVSSVLGSLQSTVDSVLFIVALDSLRFELKRFLRLG